MKIHVVIVEALRKIENKVKTQFIIEIDGFLGAPPPSPSPIVVGFLLISPYL